MEQVISPADVHYLSRNSRSRSEAEDGLIKPDLRLSNALQVAMGISDLFAS